MGENVKKVLCVLSQLKIYQLRHQGKKKKHSVVFLGWDLQGRLLQQAFRNIEKNRGSARMPEKG